MSESRWFRVNCDWWESDWLHVLSAEAQLAWIKLLGRVKSVGVGGSVKQTSTSLLARQWLQSEESVLQMLKAAEMAGAISVEDGSWVITGWSKFQNDTTNAERQKSHRERKKAGESQDLGSNSDESNGSNALRPLRNACNADKDKDKDKDKDNNISCGSADRTDHGRETFDEWFDRFRGIYPKRNGDLNVANAKKKLRELWKSKNFEPSEVIQGVERYRRWTDHEGKTGTSFVAMMSTWVNGKRWQEDYALPGDNSPVNLTLNEPSEAEKHERVVQSAMRDFGWTREEAERELRAERAG